jgi:hypothetical protein
VELQIDLQFFLSVSAISDVRVRRVTAAGRWDSKVERDREAFRVTCVVSAEAASANHASTDKRCWTIGRGCVETGEEADKLGSFIRSAESTGGVK